MALQIRMTRMQAPFAALLGVVVAVLCWDAAGVRAQDAFPWAKFVELVERKGHKAVRYGTACTRLGLDQFPGCLVFQAPYEDAEGYDHLFNVFREPTNLKVHIILAKSHGSRDSFFYLTDPTGMLRAMAIRIPGPKWSRIATTSPQAKSGFAEELVFWRNKQKQLESEPDAAIVDDGSCPKGQVRQIVGGQKPGTFQTHCVPR